MPMYKPSVVIPVIISVLCISCTIINQEKEPMKSSNTSVGPFAEGGSTEYGRWPNGPSSDPTFFPIGVWLQDPARAREYQAAGINLYVGLWKGPTEEQLTVLRAVGIRVICAQNDVGLKYKDDPVIAAWMHGDEPDNAQAIPAEKGKWGPAVPPQKIIEDYEEMVRRDPTRPVWLNFGQGVANEEFKGRAAPYEDYPEYCKGADIVSFDVYPVVGIRKPDGEKYLWYVAKGVDRLRTWTQYEKPVWNVIECTHIHNPDKKATPHQVRAEVWMSLVHGSRGIIYFVHEWEPRFVEAALLQDPEMLEAVTRINRQIHELAPVLNSPTIEEGARVRSAVEEVPIDLMVKHHGGAIYVFAVAMRMGDTHGDFEISGMTGHATAEVIGEKRSIKVVDGYFEDRFETYDVHLYRIICHGD